ncbi:hypothetical protein [Sciscionella sediminilitoris]|uniref:hypothetical protein n=1 Tax=Sciscionella sediminilitoris TaxID=1445613 RepID=UPI0012E2FB80|nr:hypothetical protein [Sciscionella sp. SE31]
MEEVVEAVMAAKPLLRPEPRRRVPPLRRAEVRDALVTAARRGRSGGALAHPIVQRYVRERDAGVTDSPVQRYASWVRAELYRLGCFTEMRDDGA